MTQQGDTEMQFHSRACKVLQETGVKKELLLQAVVLWCVSGNAHHLTRQVKQSPVSPGCSTASGQYASHVD